MKKKSQQKIAQSLDAVRLNRSTTKFQAKFMHTQPYVILCIDNEFFFALKTQRYKSYSDRKTVSLFLSVLFVRKDLHCTSLLMSLNGARIVYNSISFIYNKKKGRTPTKWCKIARRGRMKPIHGMKQRYATAAINFIVTEIYYNDMENK